MNLRHSVILALLKKDLHGLLPLILLSLAIFFIVPVIANMDISSVAGDDDFWRFLKVNINWVGFALGLLLMISVIQQDPAASLHHDWLTRPINRRDWLLAKMLFMVLVFLIPVLLSRFIIDMSEDKSLGLSLSYAFGFESMDSVVIVPLFLMAALLAPNLRKLILLMVGVFFVFLLPGWSVTQPLIALLGIELNTTLEPLMWMQAVIAVIASLVGALVIYWFLYCRRQTRHAYLAFWFAVAGMFIAVYPPQSLYNWERAFALNASLINSGNVELENQVVLQPAIACFPAAIIGDANATEAQNQLIAQARWLPEVLNQYETGAMTFATPIRYRELLTEWFTPADGRRDHSVEWRLDRIRTHARVESDSLTEDVQLRPSRTAENRSEPIAATESNYWILPADKIEAVAQDPSTRLVVEYFGSLLKPSSYELLVDGQRRNFPELGSCKAERSSSNNEIEIECLKRGAQPDLVSAQFIGLDSSRVDSSSSAVYTHDWVEALKRQSYILTLDKASLVDNTSVLVTAFKTERMLHKELVIPGILGNNTTICPLPGQSDDNIERSSSWSDKSPHEVSYISVEPGVRLEVLDWRDEINLEAPTLVLLPGLGGTVHSYDEVAPKLAQDFNVLGITRRGTGDSGKPERGYTIARLSEDVLRVMDTLGIESAILAGHSFGGEELSYLGAHHGDRVDGLIYLDAAYDRVTVNSGDDLKKHRQLSMQLPTEPPARPSEIVSYEALESYTRRLGRSGNIPEGEIIASYDLTTGNIKHDMIYLDALMQGLVAPAYDKITVPALSIYALAGSPEALMEGWYDAEDPEVQATVTELFAMERARKLPQIEKFASELRDSRVLVLEDADHWVFVSHENEVLDAMRGFIDEIIGTADSD